MNNNSSKKNIKMTNRDLILKKNLAIERKQFLRANPCVLGQIDNNDKNLLRKYTEKECNILNGQLFLNGECKKNDINYSSICAKKVIEKPLQCGNLGKNDSAPTTYIEKGQSQSMIKKIFNKDECTKLGGELVNDKYCLDKVKNIDWSSSCGDVQTDGVIKLKPWGKCVREGKTGDECKNELDEKVKNLNLKYNYKKEILNKKDALRKYKECIKNKSNHLQCALERQIQEDEDFKTTNNLPIDKDNKEKLKILFIKEWKNKKTQINSQCIDSGKEKKECSVLANLWGEIIDYSMIDGIKDSDVDKYQKKRLEEEIKKSKIMTTEVYKCNAKKTKLRCSFDKLISEIENNKHDKLSKEEYQNYLDDFIYVQKRDGIDVDSSASHYLTNDCKNNQNKSECKFIYEIWDSLIDYAMKENVFDGDVEKFKKAQRNKFSKREEDFFKCLKTGNNFSCGVKYNRNLNQDKVSFKLSKGEILEDYNNFVMDFVKERISECKKNNKKDCSHLNSVWDKEFIDIVSKPGMTDKVLDNLEKEKIEKVKKIISESKLKETFVDVYKERCFIGISWSMLLQTILVLGLMFVIFKDTINKK